MTFEMSCCRQYGETRDRSIEKRAALVNASTCCGEQVTGWQLANPQTANRKHWQNSSIATGYMQSRANSINIYRNGKQRRRG